MGAETGAVATCRWHASALQAISRGLRSGEAAGPGFARKRKIPANPQRICWNSLANLPLVDTMHHALKAWCIISWVQF